MGRNIIVPGDFILKKKMNFVYPMEENNERMNLPEKQRTHLTHKRIVHAYIWTFLITAGFGVFLIMCETTNMSFNIGIILVIVATVILIIGIVRFFIRKMQIQEYRNMKNQISKARKTGSFFL